jgi:hypothetical protein
MLGEAPVWFSCPLACLTTSTASPVPNSVLNCTVFLLALHAMASFTALVPRASSLKL